MMIVLHVVAAVLALVCGAVVLGMRKGTQRHRRMGRAYVAAIVAMTITSFGIYQLRDGPSVFHGISILTLIVVAAGLAQPLWRQEKKGWLAWHLAMMPLSYLMLVVTGVAQFFDRLPLPNEPLNAIVFLQLPLIVGFYFIVRTFRKHRGGSLAPSRNSIHPR